jgi:hypothetical protein
MLELVLMLVLVLVLASAPVSWWMLSLVLVVLWVLVLTFVKSPWPVGGKSGFGRCLDRAGGVVRRPHILLTAAASPRDLGRVLRFRYLQARASTSGKGTIRHGKVVKFAEVVSQLNLGALGVRGLKGDCKRPGGGKDAPADNAVRVSVKAEAVAAPLYCLWAAYV